MRCGNKTTMARPRQARTSPVSFGKTEPVVTDRINRLQVAVSHHKNREKPLAGGARLVLPRSATEPRRTTTPIHEDDFDPFDDPNIKWRHLDSWKSSSAEDENASTTGSSFSPIPQQQDENNVPLFDPFRLGPTSMVTAEDIDRKIDAYLQKAAIYKDNKQQNDQVVVPSPQQTGTPTKRHPLRETTLPFYIQSPKNIPARQSSTPTKSFLSERDISPIARIRDEAHSSSQNTDESASLKSCLSPNKLAGGERYSVSFNLEKSQSELRKIRQDRKERRNRAYEKKVYVSTVNRPEESKQTNSSNNNNGSAPVLQSANAPLTQSGDSASVSTASTTEDFFEQLVTRKSDDDDFFDLLVAKSSSSSNGATEWFESLLEDTTKMQSNFCDNAKFQDGNTGDDPFASLSTTHSTTMPTPSSATSGTTAGALKGAMTNTKKRNSSAVAAKKTIKLSPPPSVKLERDVQRKTPLKSDGSWVKPSTLSSPGTKSNAPKAVATAAKAPSKYDSTLDRRPSWIKKEPNSRQRNRGFILETVESGSEGEGSEREISDDTKSGGSISIEHQSFTPNGKNSISNDISPNWRSRGRSRADHLLSSIGMDNSTGVRRGVYDAFGMRRDPEARRYNHAQVDPDGILGNQLTASSSEESSSTESNGADGAAVTDTLTNVSVENYRVSGQGTHETNPLSTPKTSLLDNDSSKSMSASTKSSGDDTGPKTKPMESSKSEWTADRKLWIQDRAKKRVSDRRENAEEPKGGPHKTRSDDDSSVFSNLPSGSIVQSNQLAKDPESLPHKQKRNGISCGDCQSRTDCSMLSGVESELAILQGFFSNQAAETTDNESNNQQVQPNVGLSPTDYIGHRSDPDVANSPIKQLTTGDFEPCSPASKCDSPGQMRDFWKHLADVKTLGSFDSDSFVNGSTERRTKHKQQPTQPFIDRHTAGESDTIMALRSPQHKEDVLRSSELLKHDEQIKNAAYKSPIVPKHKRKVRKRLKRPTNGVQRQSNARYLTNAPIPQGLHPVSDDPLLHPSSVWMNPAVKQPSKDAPGNRELSEPIEDSVMYVIRPLMSADTEEEETVITDDFTRQDDNGSVAAQQSCYSCGGLTFTGWTWFS